MDLSSYLKGNENIVTKEEAGGDRFIEAESVLAAILAFFVGNAGAEAVATMVSKIDGTEDATRMSQYVEDVFPSFRELDEPESDLAVEVDRVVGKTIRDASILVAGAWLLEEVRERALVQKGLASATRYYAAKFFERMLAPQFLSAVSKYMATGNKVDLMLRVRSIAESQLVKQSPYWRTVTNASVSRAHHYGMLKAGWEVGYRGYQLEAVLDERTTPICDELHGHEFWVADGIEFLSRVAQAGPESIREIAPWVHDVSEVEGKSSRELSHGEILVPPFHNLCRTTIKLIRS